MRGKVVKGKGEAARLFDVPTANLELSKPCAFEPGVYAAWSVYKNKLYESVVCVRDEETFEVHLIGFDEDIYGKSLGVEIVEKVSDLVSRKSIAQMRRKIKSDVQKARKYFHKKKG